MEDRSSVVGKLNALLEKNYDAEKSYREAAAKSENPLIKNILKSEAETRRSFSIKIKDEIAKLGGMPEKSDGTADKFIRPGLISGQRWL